jgi:hypothetical protein
MTLPYQSYVHIQANALMLKQVLCKLLYVLCCLYWPCVSAFVRVRACPVACKYDTMVNASNSVCNRRTALSTSIFASHLCARVVAVV